MGIFKYVKIYLVYMGFSDLPVSKPFTGLVDGKGRIVLTSCVRKELKIEPNDVVYVIGIKRLGKNAQIPPENLEYEAIE